MTARHPALRPALARGLALALAATLCACPATRRETLQRVAKDWSETIRASQVLPVYPLTEDLQPGDLFLVQETVDQQHEAYEEGGFLALTNHVGRIDPTGYEAFYASSFGLGTDDKPLPRTGIDSTPPYHEVPTVAFPTYSFSTARGGGFDLALPISGVPVGISLLGARTSSGTVTIADAHTYGVDAESLDLDVRDWAARHRAFLANYGDREGTNYLRVVCRVFLTGRVDVSVQADETFEGGAEASAPAEVLSRSSAMRAPVGQESVAGEYAAGIQSLNSVLSKVQADQGPGVGGSLRVAAFSARSITLQETFERPLVFGYLGFDMAILPGGDLGPPLPTQAVLERRAQPTSTPFFSGDQASYERALRRVRDRDQAFFDECLRVLDADLAAGYEPGPGRAYPEFARRLRTWRTAPDDPALQRERLRIATGVLLTQLAPTEAP